MVWDYSVNAEVTPTATFSVDGRIINAIVRPAGDPDAVGPVTTGFGTFTFAHWYFRGQSVTTTCTTDAAVPDTAELMVTWLAQTDVSAPCVDGAATLSMADLKPGSGGTVLVWLRDKTGTSSTDAWATSDPSDRLVAGTDMWQAGGIGRVNLSVRS